MKRKPKHYRQQIYDYVEELLGRQLSFDEHDVLKEMLGEYVFSAGNMRAVFTRTFCIHDWKVDKMMEMGDKPKLFVKCVKCDKHTRKRMPSHAVRV